MTLLLVGFFFLGVPLALLLLWLRIRTVKSTSRQRFGIAAQTWGFFQPYVYACGGREKVVWSAIRAIQDKYPSHHCIVYTGDQGVSGDQIIEKAQARFNIKLKKTAVHFVFLRSRSLVEARPHPALTTLVESLGSIILGLEAILIFVPTIFVESTGYAFTMPIFKILGGCKVVCYTHCPTIRADVPSSIESKVQAPSNRGIISWSAVLKSVKLLCNRVFAKVYAYCGCCADRVMVCSSWTKGHMLQLWQLPMRTLLVYPPCSVAQFQALPINESGGEPNAEFRVISLSLFLPEKDHQLQLKVLAALKEQLPASEFSRIRFVMIGGSRNKEDEQLVVSIKRLAVELGVQNNVEFKLNVPFTDLISEMKKASAAINTMRNEHFGMCVVECMAAGLLIVAHNSGGPKMDIVTDYNSKRTGFLADSVASYTAAFVTILGMSPDERREMRENGRLSAERFSYEVFVKAFLSAVEPLVSNLN